MNQEQRMLNELPYKAWLDGLKEKRMENKKRLYNYNNLPIEKWDQRKDLIKDILGSTGDVVEVESPFMADYGRNIHVGNNFFSNYNLVILDVAPVTIGENVMFAPNVGIYTAGHPLHPDSRNSGYEYGIAITIGNNVWVGANTCILPGVTIGDNVVIGAGSVVTKDIPDNALAYGNPCKAVRDITEEDRDYYFRDRKFDVADYK